MRGPFWFLDVDGVLNDHARLSNGYTTVHHEKVKIANAIVKATGCRIVLASAWRYMVLRGAMTIDGINHLFATYGLDNAPIVGVIGPEPIYNPDRGQLCLDWMQANHGFSTAVATDDNDFGYSGKIPFVLTGRKVGLTVEHGKKIVALFRHQAKHWPNRPKGK